MSFHANRRTFMTSTAAAGLALAQPAFAQSSGRTLRLVVGYPPGGPADIIARALLSPLKASLGTNVIVENRPGAGGRLAADQVRNAEADGSVLLVTPASVVTMAPHVYKTVRYDAVRDFMPIAPIARLDLGVYAGPSAPASIKTVADMVQWMREDVKRRVCSIPGAGSTPHMAAELISRQTKLNWQLIPYQGDAPNFLALLSGEVAFGVSSLAGGMEHLRAGKLRLLALTTGARSSFVPDVPTFKESGVDMVVEDRHCVMAPKNLAPEQVQKIRAAMAAAMKAPEFSALLERMSLQKADDSGDFGQQIREESERWAAVAKSLQMSFE